MKQQIAIEKQSKARKRNEKKGYKEEGYCIYDGFCKFYASVNSSCVQTPLALGNLPSKAKNANAQA